MRSILSIIRMFSFLLSFLFQILIVKFFGIGIETDLYYLVTGIVMFFSTTFTSFFLRMYIPVYNEIKVRNKNKANEFAGAIFILLFLFSFIIALFLFFFSDFTVKLFARGFNPENILSASNILKILSIYAIFNSLSLVMNFTLQANLYLLIPFSLPLLNPLTGILAIFFFSKSYGIKAIIYARVLSSILEFIILYILFIKKTPPSFVNPISKIKEIYVLFKNSFIISLSGIIWDLKSPIATNILSYFPSGYITIFNYAHRILTILYEIASLPSLSIFYIKVSQYLPQSNIEKIKENMVSTLRGAFFSFIFAVLLISLLFEKLFYILFYPKISFEQINLLYYVFLTFIPYYTILILESPFISIIFSLKKSLKTLQVAIFFIIIYSFLIFSTIKYLGVYALPLSFSLSQLYNLFSYSFYVNHKISIINKELIENVIEFFLLILSLIFFNFLFKNNNLFRFILNLTLILLVFLILRKKLIEIFKFMFEKGSIK